MVSASIIIPTFNRTRYLKRILGYYAETVGNDFQIIVADSSSDENKARNREVIALFPSLDILYLGDYPPVANAYPKFGDALNHVIADYCVFCADDDFVTPTGIRESVHFLEKNQDFAVAQGRIIAFFLDNGGQFSWTPVYSTESISFPDASDRLKQHLSFYSQPTVYAVHKTEIMKTVYRQAVESKVDLVLFGELLLSMLTIILGKLKCLDVFYAARDATSTGTGRYLPTLQTAVEAGTYDDEYAKFRDCLAFQLSQQSQTTMKKSRKLVDGAMAAYMKEYRFPVRRLKFERRMRPVLDSLKLPAWMARGVRKFYARLIGLEGGEHVEVSRPSPVRYSTEIPPSGSGEDLMRVRHYVLASFDHE